jgi:hypothetical protein
MELGGSAHEFERSFREPPYTAGEHFADTRWKIDRSVRQQLH